jgi:hypothetical protein
MKNKKFVKMKNKKFLILFCVIFIGVAFLKRVNLPWKCMIADS